MIPDNEMRLLRKLGNPTIGLSLTSGGGVGPASVPGTVLLVSWTGNSRSIGRDTAVADTWTTPARQWTQANTVALITNTVLDVADTSGSTQATDLSPALSFAAEVNTQLPGQYAQICFVPDGQGSTGFNGGTWNAAGVPNRLSTHVTRCNAAYAYYIAHGYTVEWAFHFYVGNPDATNSAYPTLRTDYLAWKDYLRANVTGATNAPMIIGGGAAQSEVDAAADPAFTNNAIHATIGKCFNYGESYDIRIDRYNSGGTWPKVNFDGTHLNRAGTLDQGILAYKAWIRAKARTDYQSDYKALSTWANLQAAWDFDYGAGFDVVGGTNLAQIGSSQPRVRSNATQYRYNFNRPSGSGRAWSAVSTGLTPPPSYTKAVLLQLTSKAAQSCIWNDSGASGANQHRFQYVQSVDQYQFGHGSAVITNFPGADLAVDTWGLLTVTYDAATQDFVVYLNGTAKSTVPATAAHAMLNWGYIGATTSTAGTNPITGDIAFALAFNKALSAGEVSELWTFAQAQLVRH